MIGQTVSHYKILEKLGEGGMGVVYKAQDTKLDRPVALKFLPRRLATNEADQARLLQEARAAAQINHSNVCSIIDIQEFNGEQFLVMEYVDGITLRDRMNNVPLGTDRTNVATDLAIQIGEALHEAHSKGIVHRDVKSDNIMVTSKGLVKVMDFGLAKLKGSLKLTRSSSTVGTLAYMAPEQIQGGEVDARSDIFSFGVLLFEMLTGKLPFRGEHEAAVMYSILNEEPESIASFLPDASPELLHIINKSIEKDAADRYQSIGEMVVDLRRLRKDSTKVLRSSASISRPAIPRANQSQPVSTTTHSQRKKLIPLAVGTIIIAATGLFVLQPWKQTTTASGRKTLVVIPFENQGDPAKEYFADGITDEITGRLSRLSGLGVIARSSAREYKKTTKTLKEIGNELGVDYVLMGTVRWSGDQRVRISPELINVGSSIQEWSQPFDATFSDAFTIQSEIASEVATALDLQLLQTERQSLIEKPTTNPRAYDYYLQGLEYDRRGFKQEDLDLSIHMFQQAIAEDSTFAEAFAWLSIEHSSIYWFFYDRSDERIRQALITADKSLALDPQLPEAYAAKGWYYYHCNLDYENALAQFNLALKYRPNDPEVNYGMASVRRRQGKMLEAIELYRKSFEADPRAHDVIRQMGETMTLIRNYEEAEKASNRAIRLAPDLEYAYITKATNLLLWKGDVEKACAVLDSVLSQKSSQSPLVTFTRLRILRYSTDYPLVVKTIEDISPNTLDNQFGYETVSLLRGLVEQTIGNPMRATAHFDSARKEIEQSLREKPHDERLYSALGLAYAGLGRKEDAIREGLRGAELLPVEKEAWRGSMRLIDLANIYTVVGESEKAIDLLEKLLSIPSMMSKVSTRIDPRWKPLRANPRFQKLVAE